VEPVPVVGWLEGLEPLELPERAADEPDEELALPVPDELPAEGVVPPEVLPDEGVPPVDGVLGLLVVRALAALITAADRLLRAAVTLPCCAVTCVCAS
jgi:hypothetical protein